MLRQSGLMVSYVSNQIDSTFILTFIVDRSMLYFDSINFTVKISQILIDFFTTFFNHLYIYDQLHDNALVLCLIKLLIITVLFVPIYAIYLVLCILLYSIFLLQIS